MYKKKKKKVEKGKSEDFLVYNYWTCWFNLQKSHKWLLCGNMKRYAEIDQRISCSNEQTKIESKMVLSIKNFANLGKAFKVEGSSKYI